MTDVLRTRLNRFLLIAIMLMTVAIFVLGALIIWRVFLYTPPAAPLAADVRSFTVGTASVTYTVPEGCTDTSATGPNTITITFVGETCGGREILSLSGDVRLQ